MTGMSISLFIVVYMLLLRQVHEDAVTKNISRFVLTAKPSTAVLSIVMNMLLKMLSVGAAIFIALWLWDFVIAKEFFKILTVLDVDVMFDVKGTGTPAVLYKFILARFDVVLAFMMTYTATYAFSYVYLAWLRFKGAGPGEYRSMLDTIFLFNIILVFVVMLTLLLNSVD